MNDSAPSIVQPETIDELRSCILEASKCLVVGNQSKPALAACIDDEGCTLISTNRLSGIVQYEPSEFTFTAQAGTRLSELIDTLAAQGQYLPFDPMFSTHGATLGGTVAAGLSGPGRFRYGGLRDFFLGAKVILGNGNVVQVGGNVVKNAAGFDIPKFLIGSLGRYASLAQLCFKVFPRPTSTDVYCVSVDDHDAAKETIAVIASSPWEVDAVDYHASRHCVWIRIAGPCEANNKIALEMETKLGKLTRVSPDDADAFYQSITDPKSPFVTKVPTTLIRSADLCRRMDELSDTNVYVCGGGSVLWVMCNNDASEGEIESHLAATNHRGLILRGSVQHCYLNRAKASEITQKIQSVFDPERKFCGLK